MKLYGEFAFKYFRIVDYMNYCTGDSSEYGVDKEFIEESQRDMYSYITKDFKSDNDMIDLLESLYLELAEYREYMLNNAKEVSKHNKITRLKINEDKTTGQFLSLLEGISNFSVNICYKLYELKENGKSIHDFVSENDRIKKHQILDLKDFITLKKEVLGVLYEIYEL